VRICAYMCAPLAIFVSGCSLRHDGVALLSHSSPVAYVAFSPESDGVASASVDGIVGLSDPEGLRPPRVFTVAESGLGSLFGTHTSSALAVLFTDTAGSLLIAAQGAMAEIREWTTQGEPGECLWEGGSLLAVGATASGNYVVSVSPGETPDEVLVFLSSKRSSVALPARAELPLVTAVTASEAGDVVVLGWIDGGVHVFSTVNPPRLLAELRHGDSVSDIGYSPNGQLLASAGGDGPVNIWCSDTGDLWWQIDLAPARGCCIAFCPNKPYIAVGGSDGTVRVYNLESRDCEAVLKLHDRAVSALSFNSSGSMLASGGEDGLVCVSRLSLPDD